MSLFFAQRTIPTDLWHCSWNHHPLKRLQAGVPVEEFIVKGSHINHQSDDIYKLFLCIPIPSVARSAIRMKERSSQLTWTKQRSIKFREESRVYNIFEKTTNHN